MEKKLLFLAGILALTFGGCGIFDSERIVEGEVFIVTRGGENIPLGLIDIAFIESENFEKVLRENVEMFDQEVEKLQNALKDRMDKIDGLEELEKTNWAKVVTEGRAKTISDYRNVDDLIGPRAFYESTQEFLNYGKEKRKRSIYYGQNQRYYREKLALKTIDEYANTLREIDRQNEILIEEIKEFSQFLIGEALIGRITKEHSSVKTNSQGQFNLSIKTNKNYFVAAKGSRQVGGEKEVYLWVIPLPKGKEDIKNLFLSNDNLSSKEEILGLLPNANLN